MGKIINDHSKTQIQKAMNSRSNPRCKCIDVEGAEPYRLNLTYDGTGRPNIKIVCKECAMLEDEAHHCGLTTCVDCQKEFEYGTMIEWTPFDFYLESGDEPLMICVECVNKSNHKKRVALDIINSEWDQDQYIDHDY